MYDIIFISYQESNAEHRYSILKQRFPYAKRIHGVKGIHQAHIEAAKISLTDMFWVVDADAIIVEDFDFSYIPKIEEQEWVHVWHSRNPVNDLTYGYGGVKLLPRQLTLDMDTTSSDMTTSISSNLKVIEEVSNITAFNIDSFSTWRSAFRECAKLASKTIDRQKKEETDERLKTWTTYASGDYSGDALRGARDGMRFGLSSSSNLNLINNFDWLQEKYNE
jgi:hypothetical protein|tara:strand:+ start:331 stop:993 length:663 start_codon:yes stop_codon:yes gene_type:complete